MEFVRKILLKLSKYSILIGVIAVSLYLVQANVPFLKYFFEETPPLIFVEDVPPGLGVATKEIKIKVEDDQSGLELVRAKVEQSRLNEVLFSTTVPWSTNNYETSVVLNAKKLGLRKGNVKVTIEAFDRSLASNGAKHSFELPIRFDEPSIEVLSVQHNASSTGMEAVFFRVNGQNVAQSGVMVGDDFYLAIPAKEFDPDLEGVTNLQVGFFPVSYNFDSKKDKIKIISSNEVGNTSTASFYYRVRDRRFREWKYSYSDITLKQFELFDALLKITQEASSAKSRLWKDSIARPYGRETSPSVGDVLLLDGGEGRSKRFRNKVNTYRRAANEGVGSVSDGVVVASARIDDEVGAYVVVDHGIGFFSVYAGLSNVSVKVGDKVGSGDLLGFPGFLPHIEESGYMYALAFRGTSVRPEEWWDSIWVNEHIFEKSRDIKRRFQVAASLPPLEEEESNEPVEIKLPVITGIKDLPQREIPKNIIRDF